MRKYGEGMLYAALLLHMQKGCFRIRTHDQQVIKKIHYTKIVSVLHCNFIYNTD